MNFLRHIWNFWRQWRDELVPLKKSLFVVVLMAVIFFLLGRQYPESDYHKLREQLKQRHEEIRDFAAVGTRRNKEIIKIRANEKINARTIAALGEKISKLSTNNLKHREEVIFFREVLGNISAKQDLSIYALDESPGFRPNQRHLSAALVRTNKKKPFQGTYYFEVALDNSEKTVRTPEKPMALKFNLYHEIEEIMELPETVEIKNLRLLVLDEKNKIVAQETLLAGNEKRTPPVAPFDL